MALTNAVSGATTGSLSLRQEAHGGSYRASRFYDTRRGAGNASSTLMVNDAQANQLLIHVLAVGGSADGGGAGAAVAIADATGRGTVAVEAIARAGDADIGGNPGTTAVSARGVSTGGGAVTVSAEAHGGSHGDPYVTIDTVLENAVGGQTTGALRLSQSAWGGKGAYVNEPGSGIAGAARSLLTFVDNQAARVEAVVRAFGGAGGDVLGSDSPDAAGAAHALVDVSSSRMGSSVSVSSEARAGYSVLSGYATASANAAAATRGWGATASTTALAQGAAVQANARSSSLQNSQAGARTVETSAQVQDDAQTASRTQSTFGGALESFSSLLADSDGFAFSVADAQPGSSRVHAALAANSNVATALSSAGLQVIGIGAMGSAGGTATETGARYTFSLATGSEVLLGLLDFGGATSGSTDIDFSVSNFGGLLVSESFSSLADAASFFDDQALSLGHFTGSLDLQISFSIDGQQAGFSYLVATGALSNPVPEPGTWLMLLTGLGLLGGVARHSRALRSV